MRAKRATGPANQASEDRSLTQGTGGGQPPAHRPQPNRAGSMAAPTPTQDTSVPVQSDFAQEL